MLTLLFCLKSLGQGHSEVVEYSLKVKSQQILLGSLKEIARCITRLCSIMYMHYAVLFYI